MKLGKVSSAMYHQEDDPHGQRRQHAGEGRHRAHHPYHAELALVEIVTGGLESPAGGLLHRVGLHHRDPGDGLLELAGEVGEPHLDGQVAGVHGAAEGPGDQDEEGVGKQHQDRELGVQHEHDGNHGDEHDRRLDHVEETGAEQQPH